MSFCPNPAVQWSKPQNPWDPGACAPPLRFPGEATMAYPAAFLTQVVQSPAPRQNRRAPLERACADAQQPSSIVAEYPGANPTLPAAKAERNGLTNHPDIKAPADAAGSREVRDRSC